MIHIKHIIARVLDAVFPSEPEPLDAAVMADLQSRYPWHLKNASPVIVPNEIEIPPRDIK